jgi:hypothetical protein
MKMLRSKEISFSRRWRGFKKDFIKSKPLNFSRAFY